MKSKKLYIIIVILLLILFLTALFVFQKTEEKSYWKCIENNTASSTDIEGWIKIGNPKTDKPTMICGKNETEQAVKDFLNESIITLSTEKAVLGGKFYVTNVNFVNNNSGTVEYEDGHISLKASFDYKINKNYEKNSYSVEINNFKIIK